MHSPPSELLVLAAGALRRRGRLDLPPGLPVADPSREEVLACLAEAPSVSTTWLGGGEPTLRVDLPALLQGSAVPGALGLQTDGLALASPGLAARLRSWGLRRLRIPLHAARLDAHDWLVDQPGAGRLVLRAMKASLDAGLELEAELVLTRPTMDLLPETLALLARLGLGRVHVRRVLGRGAALEQMVALSPRLGLAQPIVEAAVRDARREGLEVWVHDLPRCALGGEVSALAPAGFLRRVLAPTPALEGIAEALRGPGWVAGCGRCPRDAACPGAPADYVSRFGRTELDDLCSDPEPMGITLSGGEGPPPTPPPPRAGRAPATRLVFVRRQAARSNLRGDPLDGVPGRPIPAEIPFAFPPGATTRDLRIALARLAQTGAPVLHVAGEGSLRHPEVADLLRECVRLSFRRVEIQGDIAAIAELPDRVLVGLRGLSRVTAWVLDLDAAAHDAQAGEGSFARIQAGLDRLARLCLCEVGISVPPPPPGSTAG